MSKLFNLLNEKGELEWALKNEIEVFESDLYERREELVEAFNEEIEIKLPYGTDEEELVKAMGKGFKFDIIDWNGSAEIEYAYETNDGKVVESFSNSAKYLIETEDDEMEIDIIYSFHFTRKEMV